MKGINLWTGSGKPSAGLGSLAIIAASILGACSKPGQETAQTGNPAFEVALLFEHDGCKVYRFWDGGSRRYYTTCQGSTAWSEICGKNCTLHHDNPTSTTPEQQRRTQP